MAEIVNSVYCPITKNNIDIGLCQDIQFVADDAMKENVIDFKLSDKDKKICFDCKKRIDPALL